ncbi:hypothetical protein [Catenulispora pinisilvae]|nr:hypothetical protein [Catenulispora pinisilvae]
MVTVAVVEHELSEPSEAVLCEPDGGSEVADTLLGKQAWPHVLSTLRGD